MRAGSASLGKYTLATRWLLPTRLLAASVTALEKNVHNARADEHEQPVRTVDLFRESAKTSEDDREEQRGRDRLDDRPEAAQHRLLVANFDVAPDEEVQQLAVAPELRQVQALPGLSRLDPQAFLDAGCTASPGLHCSTGNRSRRFGRRQPDQRAEPDALVRKPLEKPQTLVALPARTARPARDA